MSKKQTLIVCTEVSAFMLWILGAALVSCIVKHYCQYKTVNKFLLSKNGKTILESTLTCIFYVQNDNDSYYKHACHQSHRLL